MASITNGNSPALGITPGSELEAGIRELKEAPLEESASRLRIILGSELDKGVNNLKAAKLAPTQKRYTYTPGEDTSEQRSSTLIPNSLLGIYAGNLPDAVNDLGGKVSRKEANALRMGITLEGGAKKAVALARDYLLKNVSFGGTVDRVLGHLGLSTGGHIHAKSNSLLGRAEKELTRGTYKATGFPYRREVLTGNPVEDGISDKIAGLIEHYNGKTSNPLEIKKDGSPFDVTTQFIQTSDNMSGEAALKIGKYVDDPKVAVELGISSVWEFSGGLWRSIGEYRNEFWGIDKVHRDISLIIYHNFPDGPYDVLTLPFVPKDFSWEPNNKYVEIAAFSRNLPDYQYLGSSQEFSFEVDWYSNSGDYDAIMAMAKAVDSYSRSDAYGKNPPVVQLIGLTGYEDYLFYIKSAPYKITEKSGKMGTGLGIYPRQILQNVTLQRVQHTNPKWETYSVTNGRAS